MGIKILYSIHIHDPFKRIFKPLKFGNFNEIRNIPINIILLSREIALFWPIRPRITSLLSNKNLCSYRNMQNNVSGVMAMQQYVLNLLYSVLKFFKKSISTLKVLIIVLKNLFKFIVKSISKFPCSLVSYDFFSSGGRIGGKG